MKQILAILGIFLCLGFISAAAGVKDGTGINHEEMMEAGGQNGTPILGEGIGTEIQNRLEVMDGTLNMGEGRELKIQKEGNSFRMQMGNLSVNCQGCNLSQNELGDMTRLHAQMSNGRDAEIKIMPETASENALQRLRVRNCNQSNNCSIELKEVGVGNQTRMAYEVMLQKESKFLGLFKTKMNVQAQIDAENGEVIQSKKPWWAFLASESE